MAELTNYIWKIIVHYGAGTNSGADVYLGGVCNTDFSDIRFMDSTKTTYLNFWISEKTDSDNAVCYVKIPTIPAAPDSVQIHVVWGQGSGSTFKIAFNSDNHLNPDDDRVGIDSEMKRTQAEARVNSFVTKMATFQPNLCINTGDCIDSRDSSDVEESQEFFTTFMDAFDAVSSPIACVPGNVDFCFMGEDDWREIAVNYLDYMETGHCYGSFDLNGFHFIILDSNYDGDGNHADSTYSGGSSNSVRYIDSVQQTWLTNDLAATSLPTIVCCHEALHPVLGQHWPYSSTNPRYTAIRVTDQEDVRDILEASGKVICCFTGHMHMLETAVINGIPYCVVPSLSDDLAYYRLTDTANFYGAWLEVTIDTSIQEIKIDYYENLSVGSPGVVSTRYLYYQFGTDRASNPYTTFDLGYANTYEESAINLAEIGEWNLQGNYDSRTFEISNTATDDTSYSALQFSTLTDVDGDDSWASRSFPAQTGFYVFTFEANNIVTNKRSVFALINDVGADPTPVAGITEIYLTFDSDGDLKYKDASGVEHTIVTYSADTWYQIELVVDTASQTYDIKINGTTEVTDAPFRGDVSTFDAFVVYRGSGANYHPINPMIRNMRLRQIASTEPSYGSWTEIYG